MTFTGGYDTSRFKVTAHYVAVSAAAAAAVTILRMPCFDVTLPSVDVSKVGQAPTCNLRSPEDNLPLWQFLTVWWIRPLMSVGRSRTLNEEDVWSLPYEFQHRGLHERFRRLRGSVLSRVFRANGIDVLILTIIAVVQMLCGRA